MVVSVPALLQDELARRDWRQADLCRVLGWSTQSLSELMQGKRRLDTSMALDLECLTCEGAEYWLNAQLAADLDSARRKDSLADRNSNIRARAEVESLAPVRELIRRHYVTAKEPSDQLEQVRRLIGDDVAFGAFAKRSVNGTPFTRTQAAWMAIARDVAHTRVSNAFNCELFAKFAAELPRTVRDPEHFRRLPADFASLGVRIVYVKPFPGGRIDGVSMRLDDKPMIALSGRGKRLDKVLFALLHECAHIVSGDWLLGPRVHEDNHEQVVGDDASEAAISALATDWVFPRGMTFRGPPTRQIVQDVADEFNVAPAIVVGHLQHSGVIDWSSILSRGLPTVEEQLMSWT